MTKKPQLILSLFVCACVLLFGAACAAGLEEEARDSLKSSAAEAGITATPWRITVEGIPAEPEETALEIYRAGGLTYVPLELLSEALKLDIAWDEARETLVINPAETASEGFSLGADIMPDLIKGTGGAFLAYDGAFLMENGFPGLEVLPQATDNRGNVFSRFLALYSRPETSRLEIPLDGEYAVFSADLAYPERFANDRDIFSFEIYGDGEFLFSRELTFGHRVEHIELDVTGVSRLRIVYWSVNPDTVSGMIIGSPQFFKQEGQE
ncbi:MAG: NPCBM/NEW2 domain-containing protein [Clostridiales bacterium]|jgi:hypothetical protein|nr:NPCBM/NEW2 domain-containing protein [Clostridiales bacterium]